MPESKHNGYLRKPDWLKISLPDLHRSGNVISMLHQRHINTICSSGMCPNRSDCWGRGTATFMIGGNICTRSCRFCAVETGNPRQKIDDGEIQRIVDSVKELNLKHIVVTSVDRDDLPDYGATHWRNLLVALRRECGQLTVETLIPDFGGREDLIDMVVEQHPEVISHNLETVERLTPRVRSVATYRRSLKVLHYISSKNVRTKSGIMLGLGETHEEVLQTMDDLLEVGCKVLTIGQYLQPSLKHINVKEYCHPDYFEKLRQVGLEKGFLYVESSPFVRSSYHAERHAH